jgi:hypothetical protein
VGRHRLTGLLTARTRAGPRLSAGRTIHVGSQSSKRRAIVHCFPGLRGRHVPCRSSPACCKYRCVTDGWRSSKQATKRTGQLRAFLRMTLNLLAAYAGRGACTGALGRRQCLHARPPPTACLHAKFTGTDRQCYKRHASERPGVPYSDYGHIVYCIDIPYAPGGCAVTAVRHVRISG